MAFSKVKPEDFKELKSSEPLVIAENDDAVIIKIKSYKGMNSIDIRRYYMAKDSSGYQPTAKGVSIKLDDKDNPAIDVLKEAIKMIEEFKAGR